MADRYAQHFPFHFVVVVVIVVAKPFRTSRIDIHLNRERRRRVDLKGRRIGLKGRMERERDVWYAREVCVYVSLFAASMSGCYLSWISRGTRRHSAPTFAMIPSKVVRACAWISVLFSLSLTSVLQFVDKILKRSMHILILKYLPCKIVLWSWISFPFF